MHLSLVMRALGVLLLLYSATLIPPIAVSLWVEDGALTYFLWPLLGAFGVGLALEQLTHGKAFTLRARDGFLAAALFWAVLGAVGALPFIIGPHLAFTDALFEAFSGFTTTGATVLTDLDELPLSLLYYRQQLQWLGGMGILVLAVAVLPLLGIGGMQLFRAETPGPVKGTKLTPRIQDTARTLWLLYLLLTLACAAAYHLAGMTAFDAVAHSFTTVATGGFSPHDASLGYFDSAVIEGIACVFMVLGAISFPLHFFIVRARDPLAYLKDSETRAFLMTIIIGVAVLIAPLLQTGNGLGPAVRAVAFQAISFITTTGYTTADYTAWPSYVPFGLILLTFLGGCGGSTAGGIKIVRMMILTKQSGRELFRLVHPHGVRPVKLGDKTVELSIVESVSGFFALYTLTTAVFTLAFLAMGLDPISAFGATASSLNVLGPGLGEVATNFASVGPTVKWLAIIGMLLGRLELFTLIVLLTPAFWKS